MRLLIAAVLLFVLTFAIDAQAACGRRTPVRTVGAAVLKAQPVRRMLQAQVVRRALRAAFCPGCD